jgi:hypothetical protein
MQLGTTTGYLDDTKKFGQGYALPRSARAGVAYCDTFRNVPFTATGDVVYRDVGTPSTPYSQRITSRTTIPLGIEIWPTSYVALRLGKRFNDDVNVFTCGAGLRLNALTFDLSFAFENIGGDKPDVEAWPFLSITYSLDKEKKTAAAVHSQAVQSGNF